MLKGIMGGKGSKGIAKRERSELVTQLRTTIQKGTTTNELANLANQFQRASSIDAGELLASILSNKKYKNFIQLIQKDDLPAVIKILTSQTVKLNELLDTTTKLTPLHVCILLKKLELIRSLLSCSELDVNSTTRDGDTPLILAIKNASSSSSSRQQQQAELELSTSIVELLVSDRRCQLGRVNAIGACALSISIAKGFSPIVELLVGGGGRIRSFSAIDLAMSIKLGIIYEREDLVDILFNEMDQFSKTEFISLIERNPELQLLSNALEEHERRRGRRRAKEKGRQGGGGGMEEEVEEYESAPAGGGGVAAGRPPNITIATTPDTLATKWAKDANGRELRIGNLIEIGNHEAVRRHNPRLSQEIEFINGVCGKRCYIHDIDAEGDMYINIVDSHFAGHINSKCVRYINSGPTAKIADNQHVSIGYYVSVLEDVNAVKRLAKGHGGWKDEMGGLCGKTGKLCKIDKDGDCFVHFCTGQRQCFNPEALVGSSAYNLEAKDYNGDLLSRNSFAQIIDNPAEFQHLQQEISSGSSSKDCAELLGKLIKIHKIRLFLQYCDVLVYLNSKSYYINPKCLIASGASSKDTITNDPFDDMAGGANSRFVGAGSPIHDNRYVGASSPSRSSPTATTATTRLSEDPGYSSTTIDDFYNVVNRKASSASILSAGGSGLNDGLQIIQRKDLEMKKKLGEGGFGCVTIGSWRGTDCAIKQIRPIVTSDIDYDEILKEARIQYALKHPNIVQLYGISYETDLWMVMQLVNGMDLHSILFGQDSNGNKEKIAYSFKIKISVQTTNAISYLHDKGFLHNDIKPENIMVEKKTGNVFICDFGITRYLGSTDLRTYSQRYTDAYGGTLPYIAPECFQKDPVERRYLRPTFKSDIWALSAVFIELFTEKELFPTERLLYQCKIMNDYTAVKAIIKLITDSAIRNLLKRGLEYQAEKRPDIYEMNRILFDIMRLKKY